MQRNRSSLQRAFRVGGLVLVGRLLIGLSKEVSRAEPGREGVFGDQAWSHSSVPNTASLSDFSQPCASESSAEARWEVSPAEEKPCQAQAQEPLSKASAPRPCLQVGDGAQDSQALPRHCGAALGLPDQPPAQPQGSGSACCSPGLPCEPRRQGPGRVGLTFS